MDRTGLDVRCAKAVVARRTHRKDIARQCDCIAEQGPFTIDRPAGKAFEVEHAPQDAIRERGIGKGEEIDRASIARAVRGAVVADRPDRQPQSVERDRRAEKIVRIQLPDRDVPAAAIARSDDRLQHRRTELRIAEGEEIDGTGIEPGVGRAIVEPRTDRQPVAVQRDRRGEIVLLFQAGVQQRQTEKRCIACPQNADLLCVGEQIVAKGEQIDRARIGQQVGAPVVIRHGDGETASVQRDIADGITGLHPQDRPVLSPQAVIIDADPGFEDRCREKLVCKAEQIDRTGIGYGVADTVVQPCENGQPIAVERHRLAEMIAPDTIEIGKVEILGAGIAPTDPAFQHGTAETRIGEAEQIDRAADKAVPLAVIAIGPDGKPVAIERYAAAEKVFGIQRDRYVIGQAGIALADNPGETGGGKDLVGEGEQIHRAAIQHGIAHAVVEHRPDRQPAAVERYLLPEKVSGLQIGDREIGTAAIASAQHAAQLPAGKGRIGKGEQIDRARIAAAIGNAVVPACRNRQPVPIERYRMTENVIRLQRGDREILAAAIARSDDRTEHRRGEFGIGEAEQIDRASIGNGIAGPIVAAHAKRQAVAIERNRQVGTIPRLQPRRRHDRPRKTAGKGLQHQPVLAGRIAGVGDDDVLGVKQQRAAALAVARGFHRAAIDQRFLARNLDLPANAADQTAARDGIAKERRLLVGPDDDLARIAAHADGGNVDRHRIGRHQPERIGQFVGGQILAALELSAQPHPAAADTALGIELRREQVEPGRADIDSAAKAMAARGAELARRDDLTVRDIADRAAVQPARVDERIAGIDRTARGPDVDIAALAERGVDRDPSGEREAAGIELDLAARIGSACRKNRAEGQEIAAGNMRGAARLAAVEVDRAVEQRARRADRQRAASAAGRHRVTRCAGIAVQRSDPADIALVVLALAALALAAACRDSIGRRRKVHRDILADLHLARRGNRDLGRDQRDLAVRADLHVRGLGRADAHRLVDQIARRRCRDQHRSAARIDHAVDPDQRALVIEPGHRIADLEADQIVAMQVERESLRAAKGDAAHMRGDDAVIGHLRRDECGDARIAHGDAAMVEDLRTATARRAEAQCPARHERLVADIGAGRDKPCDIDPGILAEDDAVAVDEIHLPIGGELAQDLADLGPGDAVERDRARVGLAEIDALAEADREIVPVDDHPVARLVDPHPVGALAIDCRLAGHHLAAAGIGIGGLRRGNRKPRRAGPQCDAPTRHRPCPLAPFAIQAHRVAPIEKKMRGSLLPSGVKRDLPGQAA